MQSGIYKDLALALMSGEEHRNVSYALLARRFGAGKLSAGFKEVRSKTIRSILPKLMGMARVLGQPPSTGTSRSCVTSAAATKDASERSGALEVHVEEEQEDEDMRL